MGTVLSAIIPFTKENCIYSLIDKRYIALLIGRLEKSTSKAE
jgi:hypothetical protein